MVKILLRKHTFAFCLLVAIASVILFSSAGLAASRTYYQAHRAAIVKNAARIRQMARKGAGSKKIREMKISKSEKKEYGEILKSVKLYRFGTYSCAKDFYNEGNAYIDFTKFNRYAFGDAFQLPIGTDKVSGSYYAWFEIGREEKKVLEDYRRYCEEDDLDLRISNIYKKQVAPYKLDQYTKTALILDIVSSYLEPDDNLGKTYTIGKYPNTTSGTYEWFADLRSSVIMNSKFTTTKKVPAGNNLGIAIRTRKGVCSDYAALFKRLCLKAGIPCKIAVGCGYDTKRDIGAHAWNVVKLKGKWYHIDPFWADCGYKGDVFGATRGSFDKETKFGYAY